MADVGKWLRNKGLAPKDSLRFITSIRYDASLMKALNNMTFLYDANWQSDGKTLPVAFFYVKDYTEVMTSEISQKTMLFYNYNSPDNADAVKGGLLGVVADNIVNKPKKYKLDVIVPAGFSQIDKTYQFDSYSRQIILAQRRDSGLDMLPYIMSPLGSTVIASLVQALITALSVEDFVSTDLVTSMLSMNTANKDSLNAMWGNRSILKLKLPNGWKFKYVAIEAMNINKKGEDGDFFTGTIEVTELPILTVDKERRFGNTISKLGLLTKSTINKFETIIDRMEKTFG